MASFNLADYTYMIVDDVRVTRITIVKLLNKLGNSQTFHAENGHEALSLLENNKDSIDCIISDFNMPVMHGLQLVKKVRTGYSGIRRNIPIIMITGHGDRNLFGIALALDVNAFLLKPVSKSTLVERIQRVFGTIESKESWLKPVESYACIDVDSTIQILLRKPTVDFKYYDQKQISKSIAKYQGKQRIQESNQMQNSPSDFISSDSEIQKETSDRPSQKISSQYGSPALLRLSDVPVNSYLAKDIIGSNGQKLIGANRQLTQNLIYRLKDLVELGEPIEEIWVQIPPTIKKSKK